MKNIPDNWIELSSSGTFYLFVSPDILPHDATFIEEVFELHKKTLHRRAAANKARQDALSEETKKACLAFMNDCEAHWLRGDHGATT